MAPFHKSTFDKLSCKPIDECQTCLEPHSKNLGQHHFFFALFGHLPITSKAKWTSINHLWSLSFFCNCVFFCNLQYNIGNVALEGVPKTTHSVKSVICGPGNISVSSYEKFFGALLFSCLSQWTLCTSHSPYFDGLRSRKLHSSHAHFAFSIWTIFCWGATWMAHHWWLTGREHSSPEKEQSFTNKSWPQLISLFWL